MPNIHTAPDIGAPCAVGRRLPSWCMPGVCQYMLSCAPDKPTSAPPAMNGGTIGSSSMAPTAISPTARVRANTFGSTLPRTGYVPLAMPCIDFAVSSSTLSFVTPLFSM